MASGDTVLILYPQMGSPPDANGAALVRRNGHYLIAFDDTTDESWDFPIVLPRNYGGGGLTATIIWAAATAVVNDVRWDMQIERHQDDVQDLDADSFAAVQSVTATTASAAGEPSYDAITFTDGAQMDSLAVGESGRLRVTRDANNVADDLVGDAQIARIEIRET